MEHTLVLRALAYVQSSLPTTYVQASCALEFELDLVRVYMDMESADAARVAPGIGKAETVDSETSSRSGGGAACTLRAEKELQSFVLTLVSAACRAKRQACRQDRERVVRDAGFDPTLSSKWVVISEGGQLVSSAESHHSHSLVHQCLRRGTWSWMLGLERESSGDETTCVGVAVHPVTNSCYEDSHQVRATNFSLVLPGSADVKACLMMIFSRHLYVVRARSF